MKCEICGSEILKGQQVVQITMSDGSQLPVLVTVDFCGECCEYCEIETELM